MSFVLTKQPLVKEIFKDNYVRKIWEGGTFGYKASFRNNWHRGVDYGADVGEPLYALEDGVVTVAFEKGSTTLEKDFGIYVAIYYPKWDVTISYAHMSRLEVKANVPVTKGMRVGLVGNTGKSQGPHLDVMIASGRRIKLQTVYDNAFDFEKWTPSVKQDGKVHLKKSAKNYATGQLIPEQYKDKNYTVLESTSDKVLLKELYSWVYLKDVDNFVAPVKKSYVGKYYNSVPGTTLRNINGKAYPVKTSNYNSYKIQAEVNGRFKLVSSDFKGTEEPRTVYVDEDISRVTDKPKHRVG